MMVEQNIRRLTLKIDRFEGEPNLAFIQLMDERGFDLVSLAKESGLSQSLLSDMVEGALRRYKLQTLDQASRTLGIGIETLGLILLTADPEILSKDKNTTLQ